MRTFDLEPHLTTLPSDSHSTIRIRDVTQEDRDAWFRMRCALWPGSDADHDEDIRGFFAGTTHEPQAVLVAGDGQGLLGFVELSIRAYAEGCHTQGVGYVEGWYVEERARRQGVGRALIAAAESWARQQGCRELASDAEVENEVSRSAHLGIGFEEVGLIRCFKKSL